MFCPVAFVPERVEERLGELEQPLEEEGEQARRRDRERAEPAEREGREEDESMSTCTSCTYASGIRPAA